MKHPHVNLFGMGLHQAMHILNTQGQNFGVNTHEEVCPLHERRGEGVVLGFPDVRTMLPLTGENATQSRQDSPCHT